MHKEFNQAKRDFKAEHIFSFRTMRNKKRSVIILEVIKSYAKDLFEVYNMDETTWNFVLKKGGY